jgi:diguanylate cyclase (GGDEF)-like protein
MLSLPQRLWFTWLIVMGYALVPQPRPLLMQLLCHVAVLGFVGLTPFGSRVMGWCMAGMLVALWGAMAWLHVPDFDPVTQALQLSMAVVVLSLINAQGYRYSVLRVEVAQEAQALQRAMDRLRMVMAHDALTGLPNRDEIQRLLEKECQRHALSGRAFSVALIDLDHFKRVNDGHGHGVGDQVLASFAQHVQFKLRDIDVVGRWGGEEFLVLLPETTSVLSAGLALDRVREHVAHQRLSASVPALRVTMSAGVAVHLPGEPLDSLIGRADAALYEAKHAGRNRVGTGVVHQG